MRSRCLLVAALLLLIAGTAAAQEEFVLTIETTLGDTTETFWLQIPAGYDPQQPCPLLIGWHQLGGDHLEFKYATDFDVIANERGWIAASHRGPTQTHWNNQAAQSHVVDVIRWIEDHYSVDPARIYMVGASMGGASGMIFSNNHLDPAGPMVAAAASVSGIQDCHRRFLEQGYNNSMVGAFGGRPDEVPFTYHRNSAIYFADSTQSMHRNARHLPLFLTFGHGASDSIWRAHAEDLYAVMEEFADTVVLRESEILGHGWSGAEEELICDFLGSFTLDPLPQRISVTADEEGRWYWADIVMRQPQEAFARLEAEVDVQAAHVEVDMLRNVREATLALLPLGFSLNGAPFSCQWSVLDGGVSTLAFAEVTVEPSMVLRNGVPFASWYYDAANDRLVIIGAGTAFYTVVYEAVGVGNDGGSAGLVVWQEASGVLRYRGTDGQPFAWGLFDVTGRRVATGVVAGSRDGGGRIELPGRFGSGVWFLRVEGESVGARGRGFRVVRVR